MARFIITYYSFMLNQRNNGWLGQIDPPLCLFVAAVAATAAVVDAAAGGGLTGLAATIQKTVYIYGEKKYLREMVFLCAKFEPSPLSQVFFSKTLPQCFYYRRRRAADYGATTSRTPFSKPRIRSNNNKIHLARPYNLFYKDTSAYPQQNTTKYRGILLSHLPTCTTV